MVTAYEIIINKYFAERLFSWRRIEDEKQKNDLTNNKVLYLIISLISAADIFIYAWVMSNG